MIPGPVEVDEAVIAAMAFPAVSHLDPAFINTFGESIELLRALLCSKTAQPFIVSGSGTLGWDMITSNLLEPGDKALVVNTGVFGTRFYDCLNAYGMDVKGLSCDIGTAPDMAELKAVLCSDGPFKLVTLTHVDTSTSVLVNIQQAAHLIKSVHPQTLVAVDGVCSVAAEEIRMDDWAIDVVMTASQKAIGIAPGLCIVVASQYAMQVFNERKSPIASFYASWRRWLPIMQAYEQRKPAYFATPAVQLIMSLNVSLKQIFALGLDTVFAKHRSVSDMVKARVQSWGLDIVPAGREVAAHTLTAVYLPAGVTLGEFLPKVSAKGIVIAGGLHPVIGTKYFRIGHMGISATHDSLHYVERTLDAIKAALEECGYRCAT